MRKKKIIEQNTLLFKQVEELRQEVEELKGELKTEKQRAESLEEQLANEIASKPPIKALEEKVSADFTQQNADSYGAKAIGKIVVAATTVTAALKSSGSVYSAEKVNVALGKAEVAKAEILNAVSDDSDYNEKKIKIDSIMEKTLEYLNGIKV